jgi:hypothetical protein
LAIVKPTAFDLAVNALLGFVANEVGRARMTGIQADILRQLANRLETEHRAAVAGWKARADEAEKQLAEKTKTLEEL